MLTSDLQTLLSIGFAKIWYGYSSELRGSAPIFPTWSTNCENHHLLAGYTARQQGGRQTADQYARGEPGRKQRGGKKGWTRQM